MAMRQTLAGDSAYNKKRIGRRIVPLQERIRIRLKAYDHRVADQSTTEVVNTKCVDQHVVPHQGGGWAVRRSGASRASRVFETQDDAVTYAKQLACKEGAELYIHRGDGTITNRDSCGADSMPVVAKR